MKKIYIVGLGPGNEAMMTAAAGRRLTKAASSSDMRCMWI